MAVIGAVVGVGAVIGAINKYDNHSDYDDYDNYGDYSNYNNYSDAAERRNRRIQEKVNEIENCKYEINTYKVNSVNGYLQSDSLKKEDGVSVSVSAVKKDGDNKIQNEENENIYVEGANLKVDISTIDKVIDKIDKILEEAE